VPPDSAISLWPRQLNIRPFSCYGSSVHSDITLGIHMAIRDSMRASAAQYLQPGETIQEVFGAQTASQWLAALTGFLVFLSLNHYRIVAVTPNRIVILDAGKTSMAKARGVLGELPRSTRLGPASGLWHVIQAGDETLRVHRRFFKDIEAADSSSGSLAA
jgi:hypothetical protein